MSDSKISRSIMKKIKEILPYLKEERKKLSRCKEQESYFMTDDFLDYLKRMCEKSLEKTKKYLKK